MTLQLASIAELTVNPTIWWNIQWSSTTTLWAAYDHVKHFPNCLAGTNCHPPSNLSRFLIINYLPNASCSSSLSPLSLTPPPPSKYTPWKEPWKVRNCVMSLQRIILRENLLENSLLRLSINRISWGSEALYAWLEIHGWLTNCLGSLWHNMVIGWL